MGLLDLFRTSRPKSAQVAKERLQILVARERKFRDQPSYLRDLQRDILAAIQKYVDVDLSAVTVQMEQEGDREILEVNVVLPEDTPDRSGVSGKEAPGGGEEIPRSAQPSKDPRSIEEERR